MNALYIGKDTYRITVLDPEAVNRLRAIPGVKVDPDGRVCFQKESWSAVKQIVPGAGEPPSPQNRNGADDAGEPAPTKQGGIS